ncbi:MAG TPA: acireductone synthase [Terracidiphilus sp.]|nr:acireductone synthase [Terracidiphilus sp.]
MSRAKVYLLDVEGTVAPLTLTSEVLFPYARAHFAEFLGRNFEDVAVRADLALLAEENRIDAAPDAPRIATGCRRMPDGKPAFVGDSLKYLLWLMDRDRKSTALKSLQGKIWKAGFESGELKGTLFEDVPGAFERWSRQGRVAIYSSGSVEAQKLLFAHTNFGDLTPTISGYFDTRTGPKMESASYAAIARELGVEAGDVLFFSDAVKELDAARAAGCETRLVIRPGNAPVDDACGHAMIRSLLNEAAEDDLAGGQDGRL